MNEHIGKGKQYGTHLLIFWKEYSFCGRNGKEIRNSWWYDSQINKRKEISWHKFLVVMLSNILLATTI
jgi:hypothetical protein